MSYIEIKNLYKGFGKTTVLNDVTLHVEQGQFVTLLGPSGCGKSTLLRCIAGLETPSEGSISLDGEEITKKEPQQRGIGMVFQQYSLFPNMTAWENIAFGLRLKHLPQEEIQEAVTNILRVVEMTGKEKQYPSQLSGGQQQRVALARSIVLKPKVLLLDEPLSAIDAKLRKALQSRIREIHRELALTTVFVTHDQDEAMVLSDVIHLLNAGRIEQSGAPMELYTSPRTRFAAGFIGNYNLISATDFSAATLGLYAGDQEIAIRPETISLFSEQPHETEDAYCFPAQIAEYTPHGNVLRYTISANGCAMRADVLYNTAAQHMPGSRLWARVMKADCLRMQECG